MKPFKEVCPGGTTITCRVEGAQLPSPANECYLKEKALFAIYFPRKAYTKDGAKRSLKQLAMSGLIRIEEIIHDWLWSYKAEVVFAIRGTKKKPLPMMATSKNKRGKYGGNLPHSENPFARPSPEQWLCEGVTQMRRPDIILVFNPADRWPGRSDDWGGKKRADNLLRLIEVKFPGDTLKEGQEADYKLISTNARFSVFHVEDNRRREERESARQAQAGLLATYEKRHGKLPVSEESLQTLMLVDIPLVSEQIWQVKPVLSLWWALNVDIPAFGRAVLAESQSVSAWQVFTDGMQEAGEYLIQEAQGYIAAGYQYTGDTAAQTWAIACDYTRYGLDFLSDELQAAFAATGVWFRETGKWVIREVVEPGTDALVYAVYWLGDAGGKMIQLSKEYLLGEWQKICFYTDLTIEVLKSIKWLQMMTDLGNGMVQVALWVENHVFEIIVSVAVAAAIVVLVALMPVSGGTSGAAAAGLGDALAAFLAGAALTTATQ